MLKNISLIAAFISALTAITTSFRALGRSREDDFPSGPARRRLKALLLHLFVTSVWFGLSVIFAMPLIREHLSSGPEASFLPVIAPFILTLIICALIWRKALSQKN